MRLRWRICPVPPLVHPDLPEAALTIPDEPLLTEEDMEQEDVPPARHRKPKPVQQSANTPPVPDDNPGVSAIGTLSSGETSDTRRETTDSLAATERGLNGLGRNLNTQEQKTAAQIREYLKQAREALISGDVDGAHTLAAKAKGDAAGRTEPINRLARVLAVRALKNVPQGLKPTFILSHLRHD